MQNKKNKLVEIIEFTDPVCTWCWGSEPALRKLETRYGNQIKISFIMGGLVKDITAFYDHFNNIGGDPERSNSNIARHWVEASERHGMPVKSEGFRLFSKEHPSTYPQNIAYKAALMQDEVLANKFLRRIREASAAEAKQTNTTEVLVELASEIGLDASRFLNDFTSEGAQIAFEQDLATTAKYGAHGFPSFLIRYGEKEMMVRGYQRYEGFKAIISHLSEGAIREQLFMVNEGAILSFIATFGSVAPVEIQTAFDLSDQELESILISLDEKDQITRREAGNGYFIGPKVSVMACDSRTGVCQA
ncbi:DsbA family protein [Chitinophagaceae bacterium LB-8]|uniref:DsbA family protein n=1 Tax=Paraflavisolibacter caeni TaxID=2982496 RepID=A0A9X2XZK9_9BACT|nr:DsbA family protein [Paraflavisolibacter caeni]MCU7551817.1 DsbA family protein [Paraflavisolibacter caeni]